MSHRSVGSSFFAVAIALALEGSPQPATAAGARIVPPSGRTEPISAGTSDQGLHDVVGCVYDSKTGRKIEGPFVIRVFTREGTGLAALRTGGCYDGVALGDSSPDAWDFIEVLYQKDGRFYSQQQKLSAAASPAGFDYLGVAENTLRYDFYLDLVRAAGPQDDAVQP